MDKNKVLYLNSAFTLKELPTAAETIDSIYIEGYASTNDVDRSGDVVPTKVWEAGLTNYLKNPIILCQHDYDDPIGRMVEHRVDSTGLWVKARISAAAECFSLVKDGVLTAFSIGFRILDAEYNAAAEVFMIKELELVEISVVSVPCNQNTLFNLAKSFENDAEYKTFKQQFAPKGESAKGLESTKEANRTTKKELDMSPEELQKMLADAAQAAADRATKALEERVAKEAAEKEAAAKAAAELESKVKAAVQEQIKVGQSGAEKLLADLTAKFEEQDSKNQKSINELAAALKEKADEVKAIQASKMSFAEGKAADNYQERETAFLMSKITGKGIEGTKYGRQVVEKAGAHVPSATWELEVSRNMEAEIRRRLVVAPLLRQLDMATNVMRIPVNPEAGYATWMANSAFGTTTSAGTAATHALKEITLSAYKVATLEYLAYEEEEDALLVILPIIRDGMIRRVARSVDKAYLLGAGSGSDPVQGLAIYDATSAVQATNTGVATVANMRALRKDLGAWGLDPSSLAYVVSTEVYFDLMDDTVFQSMSQIGTQATLLTGQVGSIGNTPVLVSDAFPTKAGGAATASTNIGAICVAPGNFIAGNQRGVRFDTQDMAETQRKVLVASMRTGLTQLSTVNGQGVSTFRWS